MEIKKRLLFLSLFLMSSQCLAVTAGDLKLWTSKSVMETGGDKEQPVNNVFMAGHLRGYIKATAEILMVYKQWP
ncbi:MAG: hypothetical protein KGI54_08275 [Pseudomonadota bacterium]|nr:hypothetical protein [Pseudomonadota bacterium]